MVRIALVAAALCALLAPAAHAAGPARTQQILDRAMAQAGSGSGAYVVDLDTGQALFDEDGSVARVPASVEKLYTSATALIRYGADGTLSTTVHADARARRPRRGRVANLYLRGGGDPTFNAAAAGELADALIDATGLTEVQGRVVGDESAFDGLRGPPSEGFRTSIWVGPLSALTFNRGLHGPPPAAVPGAPAAVRRQGVHEGAAAPRRRRAPQRPRGRHAARRRRCSRAGARR